MEKVSWDSLGGLWEKETTLKNYRTIFWENSRWRNRPRSVGDLRNFTTKFLKSRRQTAIRPWQITISVFEFKYQPTYVVHVARLKSVGGTLSWEKKNCYESKDKCGRQRLVSDRLRETSQKISDFVVIRQSVELDLTVEIYERIYAAAKEHEIILWVLFWTCGRIVLESFILIFMLQIFLA